MNESYPVMWLMPVPGPVTLSLSRDAGRSWSVLAENYANPEGLSVFAWKPPREPGSEACLLRVQLDADTTMAAVMAGPFILMP